MTRLTIKALQRRIGVDDDGKFGSKSKTALGWLFSRAEVKPLTDTDFVTVAQSLGVSPAIIRAVRKVEAPRGAFDTMGRPSVLYERHVFMRNCAPKAVFNASNPDLSGQPYGPGGYGPFSAQWDRFAAACALDPHAAFSACSWGAFQNLGENWEALGYLSPFDMAYSLTTGEGAHLDCFARFVRANGLEDELRACKPGDAESCIPFVSRYNGEGFRAFNYHEKLAQAAL
jgi:hypothetical protein